MQPMPAPWASLRWGWLVPPAMLFLPARVLAAGPLAAAPAPPAAVFGIPFAGLLLSMALGPMLVPRLWHRASPMVMLFWSGAFLLAEASAIGRAAATALLRNAILGEYLPFITLLVALYAAAGGIVLAGGPWGRAGGNTVLLAVGTLLGGLIGTTAAAMILIHPFLRANAHRARKLHLVVFFIVLVANAGGALSPIGNPPLYVGYLAGVPFLWPLYRLALPLLVLSLPLLAGFYLLDRFIAGSEPAPPRPERLRLQGSVNLLLLGLVAAAELTFGAWPKGTVNLLGARIPAGHAASVLCSVVVTLISLVLTPKALRERNKFSWAPMVEVAELFAAIFITVVPVLAMLQAGPAGPLSAVFGWVTNLAGEPVPTAYFWLTGILSAFLDNTPTYLVFFGLAGNDASVLTGPLAPTLIAISAGSVFFGGLTYIGNAPNLLIRGIASDRGVRMPGFFVYWAIATLVLVGPLMLVTLLCM